ncbi:MAG: V-type ATP synthase subunit D [Fibrobacter sp.]|jgi:V/A-type H+-transporting ATPase subunit D|nr:V-type ATP synthase subunit D [Fibrobacter sp.]
MALKFQYNKTYLHQLNKGLKVRENALPTLIAKESALRLEVKKARAQSEAIEQDLEKRYAAQEESYRLWSEIPGELLRVTDVDIEIKKIAGVKTPVLRNVSFDVNRYSAFSQAAWVPSGIEMLKELASLKISLELARKKVQILEYARKKTTQKVNLYEKVQIPEYKEAIRKIKRFLEDEENLSKSSQKILKMKLAQAEAN